MDKAHQVLRDVFGFESFKLSQEHVISRLLVDNENALVVFPTGGGKSLTYQIPALCLDGLTLVVSPLLALMKDQVDYLVRHGVKAANLDSTLDISQTRFVKDEILSGSLKILYVAPERLNNEGFINLMSHVNISLLAVDEAHCISQWGASFRPEYLKIARFAVEMDVERVLCLTATATPQVVDDVCKSFFIRKEGIFRTPTYRPNLCLRVEVAASLDQKIVQLVPLLKGRKGPSIVYVTLQKHTEDVVNRLRPYGIEATIYHAGLPNEERVRVQEDFMASADGIVVCTIAFGMGIDKSNIRQVIHLYMPKSLENYSQEVGRAGRDGVLSDCVMFLSPPDFPILEGFCRGDTCSLTAIELWLQEVSLKEPSKDGTVDFNHYKQARDYDIRVRYDFAARPSTSNSQLSQQNVLGLNYAFLELKYGHLRAITPFYSVYDLTPVGNGWSSISTNNSKPAVVIRSHSRPKSTGKYEVSLLLALVGWEGSCPFEINITDAAAASGIDRADLTRQLATWELDGLITCKTSQIRACYTILKPLPKQTTEIKKMAELFHSGMVKREEEDIEKIRKVIAFATDDDCLAHNLAKYFGDENAVPDGWCGRCTFCTTGQSVEYPPHIAKPIDQDLLQGILRACPERDDPRLLARMAFGITSPRLTLGKWSTSHPLFGSMVDVDFNDLVAAFDIACREANYQKADVASLPPKKRTYSTYSGSNAQSSGSSYSKGYRQGPKRGGGTGYKRARY